MKMTIITVPHATLREVSTPVTTVDKKLLQFCNDLEETLAATESPKGVGLAAPQVNRTRRIFALNLDEKTNQPYALINPVVIEHSIDTTFGPDRDEPYLEGCLSIPGLYGPVPRWESLILEYQTLEHGELITTRMEFSDFPARVVQHELDHLDGILFTDYSLRLDLPLYQDRGPRKKMSEIDKSLLELV